MALSCLQSPNLVLYTISWLWANFSWCYMEPTWEIVSKTKCSPELFCWYSSLPNQIFSLTCLLSTQEDNRIHNSIWTSVKEMAKFELMLKPTFILVGIGTFLIHLGYFVPLFYIPDTAVSMGVERTKANFLLSIFGEFKY